MKEFKSSSLLYIVVGLLLVLFPGVLNDFFGLAIGALCLVIGVTRIYASSGENVQSVNMTIGVILTIFGIYLFINPKFLTSIIPVVAGVFVIVNAVNKITKVFNNAEPGYRKSNLVAAIILFILGAVLLFNPIGSIETLIRVFGIIVLLTGVYDFMVVTNFAIKKSKNDKVIKTIKMDE